MLFVDGENLAIRAQEHARETGGILGDYHLENIFYWPQNRKPSKFIVSGHLPIRAIARSFYYAGLQGDDDRLSSVRAQIQQIGFSTPRVFKKKKGKKTKQVDIQLAVDMLSNAYMNNYDVAILIAGDADYIPLVNEVQRLGKPVYLSFIENGLSRELKLSADSFGPFPLP